jgi:hypothetical protein
MLLTRRGVWRGFARPALEITAGDLTFAAGHGLWGAAISFDARYLNSLVCEPIPPLGTSLTFCRPNEGSRIRDKGPGITREGVTRVTGTRTCRIDLTRLVPTFCESGTCCSGRHIMMRIILIVCLVAGPIAFAGTSRASAAPVNGTVIGDLAIERVTPVRWWGHRGYYHRRWGYGYHRHWRRW